jgi:hypothetical protein
LRELDLQIRSRIDAAEAAGYQVMALFELGEGTAAHEAKEPPTVDEPVVAAEDREVEKVPKRTK